MAFCLKWDFKDLQACRWSEIRGGLSLGGIWQFTEAKCGMAIGYIVDAIPPNLVVEVLSIFMLKLQFRICFRPLFNKRTDENNDDIDDDADDYQYHDKERPCYNCFK